MAFEDWVIAHARVSSKQHKKITADDKMSFFRQLATLICSGTPLLQALNICAEQSQSNRMQIALEEVADRVASGNSLHSAITNYPDVFEPHWIEVIRTGELTGKMGLVLVELNKQIQESRETRRKVVGAMMYPMILLAVAVISVTLMLWLVVPTFAQMFHEMDAELPAITQFVVDASNFIVANGLYLLVGITVAVVLFRWYARTDTGWRQLEGAGMVTPLIGELMVQVAMHRFASNIALLLKSGIPMLETMGALCGIFQLNPIYGEALTRAQGRVAAGRSLASSLEETGLFTTMITNMVRIGEESGQLGVVMEQIAPYYKEKMDSLISKVTKLMEPVIIATMGITIAGMMLAIYLPMFEMAGKVK